jgi:Na+-translocating ferredoxin:NAD+ oxidoreductase RnfC subunit
MAPCSVCARRGSSCLVSESDSTRCSECVRLKRGDCDVHGPSHASLRKLASQQIKLEADLKSAAEEVERVRLAEERLRRESEARITATYAKFRRIQAQKRAWSAKVARAVERGLDDLEELEALERREEEESRPSKTTAVSTPAEPSATVLAIVSPDFGLPPDFD